MNLSVMLRDVLVGAVLGALLGLVVGLVLVAVTDSVQNPFWFVAVGIAVGGPIGVAYNQARQRQ